MSGETQWAPRKPSPGVGVTRHFSVKKASWGHLMGLLGNTSSMKISPQYMPQEVGVGNGSKNLQVEDRDKTSSTGSMLHLQELMAMPLGL